MKNTIVPAYSDIISTKNLYEAWQEFVQGKKNKKDVAEFSLELSRNINLLHEELATKTYRHGLYVAFAINDPKPRNIHKATVRDRLLHHAIHRTLYPFFDRLFIADSYSCRDEKGAHKAIDRFRAFGYKVSQNHTHTSSVLKCDIRKFFASIDQEILVSILKKHISDQDILWLLGRVIGSFYSTAPGKGLPLGNLTSQLLVNIYMNEFDQFMKHQLKAKYYVRYADDFVLLSRDKAELEQYLIKVEHFLCEELKLELHPNKVLLKTFASGVDFLGWVNFSDHRVLRTATKKRMMRNVTRKDATPKTVQSYLGLLGHGNARKLEVKVANGSNGVK